jgi:hypothetical protein
MRATLVVPALTAFALVACGGSTPGEAGGDAGIGSHRTDAGGVVLDAGGCSTGGAACSSGAGLADASALDAASDASTAGSCSATGPIAIAGDYTSSDGTGYWLRKSSTAATYTVVPPGAQAPSTLPQLFRIESVCSQWLLVASTDGATTDRLDWATVGGSLGICVRTVADASAAKALPAPDPDNPTSGCAGSAWTPLTQVTP